MFAREAPSYPSGFAGMVVCFACSAVLIILLRSYCIWENKKRDNIPEESFEEDGDPVALASLNLMDKTDREIHQFRYVY